MKGRKEKERVWKEGNRGRMGIYVRREGVIRKGSK